MDEDKDTAVYFYIQEDVFRDKSLTEDDIKKWFIRYQDILAEAAADTVLEALGKNTSQKMKISNTSTDDEISELLTGSRIEVVSKKENTILFSGIVPATSERPGQNPVIDRDLEK